MAAVTISSNGKVHARIGGVSIRLLPDGSWSGDGDAYLQALAATAPGDLDPAVIAIHWLIANAIRSESDRKRG